MNGINNIFDKFWIKFILPIIISAVLTYFFYLLNLCDSTKNKLFCILHNNILTAFFGISTFIQALFCFFIDRINKSQIENLIENSNQKILVNYAKSTSNQLRIEAEKLNRSENVDLVVNCLIDYDYIVTNLARCCKNDNEIEEFKEIKGLINSTKNTFDRSRNDGSIDKPFDILYTIISDLESYLSKL